jgi:hypothetical protein
MNHDASKNENTFDNNIEKKQINITGTCNRYKIKKLTTTNDSYKKSAASSKWNLEKEYYQQESQLKLLKEIKNGYDKTEMHGLIISQIEKKLCGYKHQDILKKIDNEEKLIKLNEIINTLIFSQLKCHYCKNDVHVLYEIVREKSQWTLDRINNDLGHFTDNVLIVCLECNLKRKTQNSDKYLFTKQMKIVRNDF